jgi:MFS family permease
MSSAAVPHPAVRPAVTAWQGVIYVATYAARGFYIPFIGLYLLSVGFTPVEIGILTGVSAFVRLIVVPVYSAMIDRRGAHRKLLTTQIAATGLFSLGLVLWLNKIWISSVYIARDAVDTPGAALMSQLTITSHRERGASMYGKLRALGSLGWGMSTIISGALIATGGYTLLMVLSGVLNLLILPFTRAFPERTATTNSRLDKPPKRLPAFWVIMASNFMFYVGMNSMGLFMFIYFKDYLGADDNMVGLLAAMLGIFEIPWMIWIRHIYTRMSTRMALSIGIAGQAIFTVCVALLSGTTLLFPLVIARGVFYALQNISQTVIVNEISHPANVATNQAITWVTMPALASILFSPLAGWLYEQGQGRLLFALAALIMLFGSLLLVYGRDMIAQARDQRIPLHVN